MAERKTQQTQNLPSERTCGFESHSPHQVFNVELPDCAAQPSDPSACVAPDGLGPGYSYLLGLYLGDGMLTKLPKNVWRLRIFQDSRYTELVRRCGTAIWAVSDLLPKRVSTAGCTEIYSLWKHWICLVPQHGPGPKHLRAMRLADWQSRLVAHYPQEFIKGLVHSDGCRVVNRVQRRRYEYVRYFFWNHSDEIRQLFVDACSQIGVESRPSNRYQISVAKRDSVAILESFIGPKR